MLISPLDECMCHESKVLSFNGKNTHQTPTFVNNMGGAGLHFRQNISILLPVSRQLFPKYLRCIAFDEIVFLNISKYSTLFSFHFLVKGGIETKELSMVNYFSFCFFFSFFFCVHGLYCFPGLSL